MAVGKESLCKCASSGAYGRDAWHAENARNLSEETMSVCVYIQGQAVVLELPDLEYEGFYIHPKHWEPPAQRKDVISLKNSEATL